MNNNEIRLIKDLQNHYDQKQEINDEFLKSLTENYGSIRGVLMNVILKYDPEAEITDQYLDAKLKQYNIGLNTSTSQNVTNKLIEDEVDGSVANDETKEKSSTIDSTSKKTQIKWVWPIVIISLVMTSGAIFFFLKFNNSVAQENSMDKNMNEKVWVDDAGNEHVFTDADANFVEDAIITVKVNIEKNDDGTAKATVTSTTVDNGETVVKEEVFEGTLEEVKSKLEAFEEGINVDLDNKP